MVCITPLKYSTVFPLIHVSFIRGTCVTSENRKKAHNLRLGENYGKSQMKYTILYMIQRGNETPLCKFIQYTYAIPMVDRARVD